MHKKCVILTLTILVILLGSIICYFVSQSRKDSSQNLSDVSVVEATVLSKKSNYLTVALKKNDTQYPNSFRVEVDRNTKLLKEDYTISIKAIEQGDTIQIYYSGSIGETDPPCLIGCSKIVVITKWILGGYHLRKREYLLCFF